MITSIRRRVAVTVLAGTALAAGCAGYAAASGTSATAPVRACVNSAHRLALLSAKGACPKGYAAVSLDRTGPTGKTGKTGRTGATGAAGPQGPGAVAVNVSTTDGSVTHGHTATVPGVGLKLFLSCRVGSKWGVQLYSDDSATVFDVHGSSIYTGPASAFLDAGGAGQAITPGAGFVDASVTSNALLGADWIVPSAGELALQLIVTRTIGTVLHTDDVSVIAKVTSTSCDMHAVATPAS